MTVSVSGPSGATVPLTGLQTGVEASKPAAAAFSLYYATDTGRLFMSNGTTVTQIGPGKELARQEITGSFTTTNATPQDVTGLNALVVPVLTRPIELEFWGIVGASLANETAYVGIYEGATRLAVCEHIAAAAGGQAACVAKVRLTPSTGSHTYKAKLSSTNVLSTAGIYGDATFTAYLRCLEL